MKTGGKIDVKKNRIGWSLTNKICDVKGKQNKRKTTEILKTRKSKEELNPVGNERKYEKKIK